MAWLGHREYMRCRRHDEEIGKLIEESVAEVMHSASPWFRSGGGEELLGNWEWAADMPSVGGTGPSHSALVLIG